MRLFQKISNIIIITIIFFLVLNILVAISWKIRTNLKFKNLKPYTNVVLDILDLNEKEGLILYLETWINREYTYDQYTEYAENQTPEQKYVNISERYGRRILNNKNCERFFYFYGGSTTFGYNVTDYQTFPSYFKEILSNNHSSKNYCVYNFGRAGYASSQENILFQKHLLRNRFKAGDFIFFVDGVNEGGNRDGINTKFLYDTQKMSDQKYWDMYKAGFKMFFHSIPVIQLIHRLQHRKLTNPDNGSLQKGTQCEPLEELIKIKGLLTCLPLEDILNVYQTNVNIRIGICKKFNLNCYSLLQPLSAVHGNYFKVYEKMRTIETGMLKLDSTYIKKMKERHSQFQSVENIIDISSSLDNETELSYVDRSHYSPPANKAIAKYIYQIVKDKIN